MVSGRYNVFELLPVLVLDREFMSQSGKLLLTKDETTAGLFFEEGKLVAVDYVAYESLLWTRLRFHDMIAHSNIRPLIRSNKSQRESLYKLLTKSVNRGLQIQGVLKDYIFGALDELVLWEDAEVSWFPNEEYEYVSGRLTNGEPLKRVLNMMVTRTKYKFDHYEQWGFKNNYQFLYGIVAVDQDYVAKNKVMAHDDIESLILSAYNFQVKDLHERTGYSLFDIIYLVDHLSHRARMQIENPSGRQHAVYPVIPDNRQWDTNSYRTGFDNSDEDINNEVFTREYVVPEPAVLVNEEQEPAAPFTAPNPVTVLEPTHQTTRTEIEAGFDATINDTSEEVDTTMLGPLPHVDIHGLPDRQDIPEAELRKEYKALSELADIFIDRKTVVPETPEPALSEPQPEPEEPENTPVEPIIETQRTAQTLTETPALEPSATQPSITPTTNIEEKVKTLMSNLSGNPTEDGLFGILSQLQEGLKAKRDQIEAIQYQITNKESEVTAARATTNRLEEDLGRLLLEREKASSDYEQALNVLNNLK